MPKKMLPLFHSVRSKCKTNHDSLAHVFFCTLSQLHVFCSSFELLTEFSVSFVIGLSDYFGSGLYDTRFKTSHTCTFDC